MEVMIGVAMAGVVMGMAGKYEEGVQKERGYEAQADLTMAETQQKEQDARKRLDLLLGRQRALYAKAGVDLASGSPLLVMTETAKEGGEEISRIKQGGEYEAEMYRMYGEQAYQSGIMGGISEFLSGAGRAGSMAYGQGMFGKGGSSGSGGPKIKSPYSGSYR